jgi:hypothetical protein
MVLLLYLFDWLIVHSLPPNPNNKLVKLNQVFFKYFLDKITGWRV